MVEIKLLLHIVDYMESTGTTYKLVQVSINQDLVDRVNRKNNSLYTLDELEKATDKCLAREWLKRTALGSGNYSHLGITPKGVGAAISKRNSDELKASRGLMKRASDYVEEHKGLFIVLGFLLALSTFALKLFGE